MMRSLRGIFVLEQRGAVKFRQRQGRAGSAQGTSPRGRRMPDR